MAARTTNVQALVPGAPPPGTRAKLWLELITGFILVWVCIFVFGTLSRYIPGAAHMAEVIDERGLRATAIYYTDLDESYEGSEYIRHSLESARGKE
ncbi:MAG: hypothetical protein WAW37_05480 [Syntrophobacteraceae bacterium]